MTAGAVPVLTLLTGTLAPLGPRGAPSGISKRPVAGRVWLGRERLGNDEQGDRRHHGGPEKAVHHYPFEHYPFEHYPPWRLEVDERDLLAQPGAFGENLSTTGLIEADLAVGDTFRLGGATIQVSQGRQPCWRLNSRFGVPDMALRMQAGGRGGTTGCSRKAGSRPAASSTSLIGSAPIGPSRTSGARSTWTR